MKCLSSCAGLFACLLLASNARSETDARDGEALTYLPNNTVALLGYFRHVSSSDTSNFTQDIGVFRAAYLLKVGDLAIVPFDMFLPVVDITLYTGMATLHGSGIGDLTYLPTIEYILRQGPNHTYFQFNPNFTAPTGNYSTSKLINISGNRWVIKPQLRIGQRFAKAITAEALGNVAIFTENSEAVVPNPMTGAPLKTTLQQSPTFGAELHLAADLSKTFFASVSYYYSKEGDEKYLAPLNVTLEQPTVQTMRFSWGIRFEKNSSVLLQLNQDIAASNGGSISRFVGVRIAHAFFEVPEPPPGAEGPAK